MGYPSRSTLFPEEVYNRLIEAVSHGKEVRVVPKSRGNGHYMKNMFYRYRQVLRNEGKLDLANACDMIEIVPDGDALLFRGRDQASYARSITEALDKLEKV